MVKSSVITINVLVVLTALLVGLLHGQPNGLQVRSDFVSGLVTIGGLAIIASAGNIRRAVATPPPCR